MKGGLQMYSKDKLIDILLEYRHLVQILSEVDYVLQIAAKIICDKYNMVLVFKNEDGSDVLLAEEGANKGINIVVYEDIGIAITGIQTIKQEIWKNENIYLR